MQLLRASSALSRAPSRRGRGFVVNVQAAATCRIVFKVHHRVDYGSSLLVTGGAKGLGDWNPTNSLALNWSTGDVWTAELEMAVGSSVEYKFIVKKPSTTEWQPGSNRAFSVPTAAKAELSDSWNSNSNVKVAVLEHAAPAVPQESEPNHSLVARIEEATAVAQSLDQVAHIHPVSTVENLDAEAEVPSLPVPTAVMEPRRPLAANNIVNAMPFGAIPVAASASAAVDAQVQYEEADTLEVLEVKSGFGGVMLQTPLLADQRRVKTKDINHLTMSELRAHLKKRGLVHSGNRRQLITRLEQAGAL